MHALPIVLGLLCCAVVALDAFQSVILPRRATGRFRLTRLFYIATWGPWVLLGERVGSLKRREQFYSVYGPLSLLVLLSLWGTLLITGFALVLFGLGTPYQDTSLPPGPTLTTSLRTDLYVSGTTLTTLGPGDVVPRSQLARMVMIAESGTGLGFVALVISYVPVLYAAFSRREVAVALLDARAGSPPTAAELLQRHDFEGGQAALIELLAEWERWAAELLESHISYPLLCYYRSQHDNQSWLAALTTILDVCALLITTVEGPATRQAQLTFAIARHAVIDLSQVFYLGKNDWHQFSAASINRLNDETFARLCSSLSSVELRLCGDLRSHERLLAIRDLYEPRAQALAKHLCMPLPQWIAEPRATDQWRKVASLRSGASREEVFGTVQHISLEATAVRLEEEH